MAKRSRGILREIQAERTLAILAPSGVDLADMNWKTTLPALALTALLMNLAFPTVGWGMLIWVAFLPLLHLTEAKTWQRFFWGWLGGLLIQAFGYLWIFYTIRDFGGLPASLSAIGALLFWLYQGLDVAIWLCIGPLLFRKWPFVFKVLGMAGLWFLLQGVLYPYIFPANHGAALAGNAVFGMGAAFWSGKGLTFLIIAFQTFLALPGDAKLWVRITGAAFMLVCPLLGHLVPRDQEHETLSIGVVQPNLIPWAKRGHLTSRKILDAHEKPTRDWIGQPIDLVVWPETAIPFDLRQSDSYQEYFVELAQQLGAPLVTGAVGVFAENDYANEVWMFSPQGGQPAIYQKEQLVLFSETLPWLLSWARFFDPALGGFRKGTANQSFSHRDQKWVPLVCFEALFPRLVRKYQGNLLLNLTNDAWFGETKASALHLQHIRNRSVEAGVPLIRATNSGISCWVDAKGEIHQATPLYEPHAVIFKVPTPTAIPVRMDGVGEGIVAWLSWILTLGGTAWMIRNKLVKAPIPGYVKPKGS